VERRDGVEVVVARLVVGRRPPLGRLGDEVDGDDRVRAREASSSVLSAKRASPLARLTSASSASSSIGQAPVAEAAGWVGERPPEDLGDVLVRSARSTTTRERERSGELTSNEGFSVVAPDQDDRAVLDVGRIGVLLRLVEAVDLVDEEDGPAALQAEPVGRLLDRRPQVATPAETALRAAKWALVVVATRRATVVLPSRADPTG
jgi:hypothetical protein